MKHFIKQFIKKSLLYQIIYNWLNNKRQMKELTEWVRKGKPMPPPHIIKQQTLETYAKMFNLKVLVETGTYYGDMVEAMKKRFDYIYSIELNRELYEKAKERFKRDKHVELIHGDSSTELVKVINKLDQPALFWLDGHYSAGVTSRGEKDTPVFEELTHIFKAEETHHVVVIDDARCFGTDPAYPRFVELSDLVKSLRPDINIEVRDDSIRITPKRGI